MGTSKTLAEKLRIVVTIDRADGTRETRGCCVKADFDGSLRVSMIPEATYLLWVITQVRGRDEVLAHMPRLGAAMADHEVHHRLGVISPD